MKMKKKRRGNRTTHGMRHTRIYSIWTNIRTRTRYKKYKNYAGRGIKCLWSSFEEFHRDMGANYKDDLTIERIDVNGHYCKENCLWIPMSEQQNNTRKSVKFKGETMAQAERRLGLGRGTIWERIHGHGWSHEKAFLEKRNPKRTLKTELHSSYKGELAVTASERLGSTNRDLVNIRIRHGWDRERAFSTPVRQGNYGKS